MKKFFSLVLALVMALSLTTVAWGADPVAKIGDTPYGSLQAAVDDAGAGAIIVLQNDTAVSGVVEGVGVKVPTGKDITIDFNGLTYKITSAVGDYGTLGFQLLKDSDVVLKNGAITSKAGSNVKMLINNYSNLTLYDIMLDGSNLDGNAPNYTLSNNNGDTTIGSGTTIVAKDNGVAFDVCWSDYYTDGAQVTVEDGAVIEGEVALTLWDQTTYDANQSILTVNGGSFDSAITIDDTYGADVDDVKDFVTISDGTFAVAPAEEFLADGMQLLANGSVVPTAASSAIAPTLYQWNNTTKEWDTYCIALGDDLNDLKMGADEKCLPCFFIDGKYFVEVSDSAATFKLVYGKQIVFLKDVPSTAVCYVDIASVLTVVDADDAECGDWNVANLDDDDVYYISYTKKGDAVDGVWVKDKNGSVQILVNDKIVDVEELTVGTDIKFMAHTWKGYEVANYEYVSVKCDECGNVAKLYANGTAAGKKAVKIVDDQGATMGWITYADATNYGSGAAPIKPSTDKTVTSAETFDAGIAMYVGMSVMAAAGSAVVIGKKKD